MHAPLTDRNARSGRLAVLALVTLVATACASDPPRAAVGLTATGCPPGESHGSGIEVEPGLVLTAAHVVRGGGEIAVTNGYVTTTGEIAAFDPTMDLALVRTERPMGRQFSLGDGDVAHGATGYAYVVRDDEIVALPVTVRRRINLRTEDVYIDEVHDRPAWELDADTVAGDSGGPVIVDGEVIGVLSLRSGKYESRAYAVDPVRAGDTIRTQHRTGDLSAVDLARCT